MSVIIPPTAETLLARLRDEATSLRVLTHRKGDGYEARCIENNLTAQGPTPETAERQWLAFYAAALEHPKSAALLSGRAPFAYEGAYHQTIEWHKSHP